MAHSNALYQRDVRLKSVERVTVAIAAVALAATCALVAGIEASAHRTVAAPVPGPTVYVTETVTVTQTPVPTPSPRHAIKAVAAPKPSPTPHKVLYTPKTTPKKPVAASGGS
jgi:hypothetical protein